MMAFADEGYELEIPVKAGPRVIGATFPRSLGGRGYSTPTPWVSLSCNRAAGF